MKRPTENSTCKINGQTITTFDKSEFKYDICDHMLVRDVNDKRINIILKKNCNDDKTTCTKQLTIIDKIAEYKLDLFQNMTIILNGIR